MKVCTFSPNLISDQILFLFLDEWRHDEWNGLQQEAPKTPQQGGVMHVTDFKLINVGSPVGKSYTAGGNLAWISPFWTPASVPLIESAINMLMQGNFKNPVPLEITVMVCSHSDPGNPQHRLQSSLKRLSPEEEHLAYILATVRDVHAGEAVEDWF